MDTPEPTIMQLADALMQFAKSQTTDKDLISDAFQVAQQVSFAELLQARRS